MTGVNLQKTLFIDIETVSGFATYQELSPQIQQLWNKKSKLVDKDSDDYAATYQKYAGIYAEFGKIVCISLGYFIDKELTEFRVKSCFGDNEAEIITEVYSIFNKFFKDNTFFLAGHNIKEFDVPYMCRRSLINKIDLSFFFKDMQNRKPWDNPLVDTLHIWRFGDYKSYISLELLATILSVPTPKDDIDGSKVGEVYWQERNVERIAAYCGKDVLTVAQVLLYLNNLPLLSEDKVSFL
jgi:3'-5' exonuclease